MWRPYRGSNGNGSRRTGSGLRRLLLMRCYFVKDAKIVAAQDLPGLSCDEAVEIARTMLEEHASSYDEVEVWSSYPKDFPAWLHSP